MKRERLIVLKGCEGEYDSYVEFITAIYLAKIDDKFNLDKEYSTYLSIFYNARGFNATITNGGYFKFVWEKGEAQQRKTELRKFKKTHENELSLAYYLENILRAKKMENTIETYV